MREVGAKAGAGAKAALECGAKAGAGADADATRDRVLGGATRAVIVFTVLLDEDELDAIVLIVSRATESKAKINADAKEGAGTRARICVRVCVYVEKCS